jgi:hypothetical protein
MRNPRKSSRNVVEVLPAVAVSVVVGVTYCILNVSESRAKTAGSPQVRAAGFPFEVAAGRPAFRRLEKRREGRNSQSERRVKLPDPKELVAAEPDALYPESSLRKIPNLWDDSMTIGSSWAFLSKKVRGQITSPGASAHWSELVLHHSQSLGGNAAMFDMYHRKVRGIEYGLAYHFVIGNGAYSGDGAIEVGSRWREQLAAGALPGAEPRSGAISICLVGDYASHPPTQNQLRALGELVGFLRARLGHLEVKPHFRSGDGLNSCPGRYFPQDFVLNGLNG